MDPPAESRVVKNSAAQLVARVVELGGMFVLTAAVARYWGTRDLGKFSLVVTLVGLFAFAADWGVSLLLMRELARRRSHSGRQVGGGLLWVLWWSPFAGLAAVLVSRGLGYPKDLQLGILLGTVWMALGALIQIFRSALYAAEHSEVDIPTVLVERGLAIALGLAVVIGRGTLQALVSVLILSRVAALGTIAALYARQAGEPIVMRTGDALALGRAAIPFGLNVLGTMLYVQADILMLSWFRPLEEVGLYRAAGAIIVPLAALGVLLSNALLPAAVRAFDAGDHGQISEMHLHTLRYAMVVGVPVGTVLLAIADRIIPAVYGTGFEPSVLALRILALILPLRLLNGNLATVLTAAGWQHIRTRIVWIGAIINVLLNLVAIPMFGLLGACVTTVLTDAAISTLLYVRARRVARLAAISHALGSPLASAAILAASLVLLRDTPLGISMLAGSIGYLGALMMTRGVTSTDFSRLRAALQLLSSDLFVIRRRRTD